MKLNNKTLLFLLLLISFLISALSVGLGFVATKAYIEAGREIPAQFNENDFKKLEQHPGNFRPPEPPREFKNGPRGKHRPPKMMFLPVVMTFIMLFLFLLAGLFIYILITKKQVNLIKEVFHQLKHGNLKARLPESKLDQLTGISHEFNSMALEIEKLVEKLKDVDLNRRVLLQELAHDLRTPVASMKNMVETNLNFDEKLSPTERTTNLSLTLKEIHYFERLVNDLLFLSGVHDSKYSGRFEEITLLPLLNHEAQLCEEMNPRLSIHIQGKVETSIYADQYLIQRLIKNVLKNATRFAKKEIIINVNTQNQLAELTIIDDGPGFNDESLKNFGIKRTISRTLNTDESDISIGLGSIIMAKICEIHDGSIKASNLVMNQELKGAKVSINLPIFKG